MKQTSKLCKAAAVSIGALALCVSTQAQSVTNPCPNRVISWNANTGGYGTVNPTDLAGLAPATNWVDMQINNITTGMPDNMGNTTTMDCGLIYFNISAIPWPTASDPGMDANGTANKRILNVYLNAGPSGWNPWTTNVAVSLTNIPFARYDVVVYLDADASGRKSVVDNGQGTAYNISTVGTAFRTGDNCTFIPSTETNSGVYPAADFVFFPGMTSPNAVFTEKPKSGTDQWLGVCAFQVIESSNVYVLYGPAPASQIVPVGQPAGFKVMAGGLDPSYQWRHAGTNIVGATNATYSIASAATGQDGNYDVVVTNSFSSVTSLVATLVFYAPKDLEWYGNGATWDTSSSFWTANGTSTTTYTETDKVRFGPRGSAQNSVTLSATHTPSVVVISNASYTFTSGGLAGAGSLRLMNNAKFILDTIDGRSGPTVIDSGCIFQLDNGDTAGSMGAGALTNNGALVFNAGGDEAYGYPIYGSGNITNIGTSGRITLGGTVNANYLVQAGTGELLLQGNNSISGGIGIFGGNVQVVNGASFGGAPVTVTGGDLILYFGLDYPGSSLNLAGGRLRGTGTWEGPVTLTANSEIMAETTITLANPTGFNSANTLTISGGTVLFNSAANVSVSSSISGGGSLSQTGSGTVIFTGDMSGLTGVTTVSAGTLGGITTNGGSMNVAAGATLAPGTPSAIGTMEIDGGLTLNGNLAVKVNKSLAQSNDVIVTSSANNGGTGMVTVKNLGPALAVGNKFTLVSSPVTGAETMSVMGGGVIWTNNLAVDGSISVLVAPVPKPVITSTVASASTLVFSGNSGYPGSPYAVLATTDLTSPWTVIATGNFSDTGTFSVTNPVTAGVPQMFYRLEQ